MIFRSQSILMDADCVDTADFMNDCQTEKHYDSLQVWERMELAMQRKLDGFSGGTDAIPDSGRIFPGAVQNLRRIRWESAV